MSSKVLEAIKAREAAKKPKPKPKPEKDAKADGDSKP